jgi:hypothetical protein
MIEYFKDDFERPAILEVFRRVQKRGTFKKKWSNHTIHQRVLISCSELWVWNEKTQVLFIGKLD